jgi:peptidase E
MDLHLFSTPGKDDLRYILAASRPYLEGRDDPRVAYLPAAALSDRWQAYTENAFRGLARVETLRTELDTLAEMEAVLRRAALLYIPGGNTFLLSHRLQLGKLMDSLRKKVVGGLPVVAFSAGTVLCGPNILTSRDMNLVGTGQFAGLNLCPFDFCVHYPLDGSGQAVLDDWLREYHVFHDNPLLMLSDGAYIQVAGKTTRLVRGEAWLLRKGSEKEKLAPGEAVKSRLSV